MNLVPIDSGLAALKHQVIDAFSRSTIDGAQRALADTGNPLRLNFFSTAMRILFEHMMDTLSPPDQVARTSWFKVERLDGKPSRGQRIMFAIQGGLSETFVAQNLGIDPIPLRKRLLATVDELSKHIHARKNTVILDLDDQNTLVQAMTAAMADFLNVMRDCRSTVIEPIAEALDAAAVDTLISETIAEIDELAPHNSLDEVDVDSVIVLAIGPDTITYRATGSVSVTLQWGSNSDMRRGDGMELGEVFPYYCDIEVPLDDPWDLDLAETTFAVDTGKWRDVRS